MGISDFWLQSNNGKNISLGNLKELKKSDLNGNTALLRLFNIFDTQTADGTKGSDGVLNKQELNSLFDTMAKVAASKGNSSIFETEEAEDFLGSTQTAEGKTLKELGVKVSDMFEFLTKLVKNQNTPITVDNMPTNVNLTEEQAKEEVLSILSNDAAEARTLLMTQDNGKVSDLYNKYKEWKDDDLALSNIEEAIMLQEEGAENLYKAKEGKLSKREYFLQNREHLKMMMKRRLFRKDENTGLDFLDRNRGKMSKDEFAKLMEDFINQEIDKIDRLDSLQQLKHTLLVTTDARTEQMLKNFQKKAENNTIHDPINERNLNEIEKPLVPLEFDTTEPITFEEVFKYERNTEYSKEKVENYLKQKQKTDYALSAYNKYQTFQAGGDDLLANYKKSIQLHSDMDGNSVGGKGLNPSEHASNIVKLFSSYFANIFNPDLAKEELQKLISDNKLPLSINTNEKGEISLDLSQITDDAEKNRVLNKLITLEQAKLKGQLETVLGGDIEEKMQAISQDTQTAYNSAYGTEFSNELVQLMSDDNKTFIPYYTGNTSMLGMGATVVGVILCFTPAAPLGVGMVTIGNTLAIGGMAAESVLGYTEAYTRSHRDDEELKELSKTLIMNAGGFVIGMKAGQAGMKAFNKLIDKKLVEVFKTEMVKGNRAAALKQVFTNPEYLKNFMQAAGVKLSADFLISYAGDLTMMGILDTNDDWMSLLQSNLIGIMAGISGDIKDVGNLGIKGDRYRKLRQKEAEGGVNGKKLTAKEAEELAKLRNDPDIKRAYPDDETTSQTVKQNDNNVLKGKINDQKLLDELKNLSDKENEKVGHETLKPEVKEGVNDGVGHEKTNLKGNEQKILKMQDDIKKALFNPQEFAPINPETKRREFGYFLNAEGNSLFILASRIAEIKDEKLLSLILEELTTPWPNVTSMLCITELSNFKQGGYEALSSELKSRIQPYHYYSKSYDVKLQEIKAIQDPVERTKNLTELNITVASKLLETCARTNETFFDYLYDNFFLQTMPEEYRNIINEINTLTGTKVITNLDFMGYKFGNNKPNVLKIDSNILQNFNNLTPELKSYVINHNHVAQDSDYLDYWLRAFNDGKFTKEDMQNIIKRDLMNICDVRSIDILAKMDDKTYDNFLKSGLLEYTKNKTNENIGHLNVKNAIEIFNTLTPDEIKIFNQRQIGYLRTDASLTLDVELSIALAKMSEADWKEINQLNMIKDNKIDFATHYDDITDAFEKDDINSAILTKVIKNYSEIKEPLKMLASKGVTSSRVMLELGILRDGIRPESVEEFNNFNWNIGIENVQKLKAKILQEPKKYVNGKYETEQEYIDIVNKFFNTNDMRLTKLASFIDKEGLDCLMRMRFNDVEEYLGILDDFNFDDMKLYKDLCNSCNVDGKPFLPLQKVEFIDLIEAYKTNGLGTEPISVMADSGKINVGKLHIDLFNRIMKNVGMSEEEIASIPKDKLVSWDMKYMHLLAKEMEGDSTPEDAMHRATKFGDRAFNDLIRAVNLGDFNRFIHDETNIYGQTNAKTKARFAELNLDIEKFEHPSKSCEIRRTFMDKNTEKINQICSQIVEDIENLRKTPVKGIIDKQFPHCIKNGEFIIPTEIANNKAKLNEFVNNVIKQLEPVWKRAQGNLSNPERAQKAQNTLTILDHLKQRISDISKVEESKVSKSYDLTIKMIDNIPQKDMFQGNFSTCCIGMGGGNGRAMPHYLMNSAYNMIELVDNNTGKTIGNALCFIVKGVDGNPKFIIDNIEINNAQKPSDENGILIRNAITEYAANVAREMSGRDDIEIYMGGDYNDVPISDLKSSYQIVEFVGDIDCEDIYMDLYKGWVDKTEFKQKCKLYKLKGNPPRKVSI